MTLYKRFKQMIKNSEDSGGLVLDASGMVDRVLKADSLRNIGREELEERYAKALVAVCLYEHGYRSVLRGKGYYVNISNCENPHYMAKVYENAKGSAASKHEVVIAIKKICKDKADSADYPQIQFEFDEDGEPTLSEEITWNKLLEMLEKEAHGETP